MTQTAFLTSAAVGHAGAASPVQVGLTGAGRPHRLPRSRAGAALIAAHAGLFIVTLGVLDTAIGWPDVLREPPAVVFERIGAAALATKLGYSSYLLSSLLMVPIAFLARDLMRRAGGVGSWVDSLAFFGAAAGVLKAIGITRWLMTMPALAGLHAAAPDEASRQAVQAVYVGLNAYGGSIGELLGVQLFSGVWFAGVSGALLALGGHRISGGLGLVVAALTLALAGRPFLPQLGALEMVAGPLWLVWLLVLAGVLARGRA